MVQGLLVYDKKRKASSKDDETEFEDVLELVEYNNYSKDVSDLNILLEKEKEFLGDKLDRLIMFLFRDKVLDEWIDAENSNPPKSTRGLLDREKQRTMVVVENLLKLHDYEYFENPEDIPKKIEFQKKGRRRGDKTQREILTEIVLDSKMKTLKLDCKKKIESMRR